MTVCTVCYVLNIELPAPLQHSQLKQQQWYFPALHNTVSVTPALYWAWKKLILSSQKNGHRCIKMTGPSEDAQVPDCLTASAWDLLSNLDRGMTQKAAPSPSGSSGTFLLVHLFHRREDWKGNRASGNKVFQLCSAAPAWLAGRVQLALTRSTPAVRLPK